MINISQMKWSKYSKTFLFSVGLMLLSLLSSQSLKAQVDTLNKYILTPKARPEPHINGAKIFGVRPGHPILFTIPVSGERPIAFSVKGLPKGVRLDAVNGRLSGRIERKGDYSISLKVSNKYGKCSSTLWIKVGEDIALTPPMGWNSWNIYGNKVNQEVVSANLKAMASSGLINHGWTYVNIDDAWQGHRGGDFNGILPDSAVFPDMQGLINEAHYLGLKMGIYSSPWVETYAKHIGGSAMNPQGDFEPTKEKIPHREKLIPYAIGKYVFVDQDVRQWVKWGFDYLKYDWNPIEYPETKLMYDALRNSGRDIVFSLSNSTPFQSIKQLSTVANSWRTGGDIRDNWKSLKARLFTQDKWAPYAHPGHWNDPDMMVLGYVGWGKTPHPTQLTADEQYTHMSAWCLMSVPLLLGNDLTKLDDFTLSLLTNDEVIAVNQDPLGKQATLISTDGENGVMAKPLADGTYAAGLFNTGDQGQQEVTLKWRDLGIKGKYIVRDLWRQKDLGVFDNAFSTMVNQHGVVMISLRSASQ